MIEEIDRYREYSDSIRPPEPPRANIRESNCCRRQSLSGYGHSSGVCIVSGRPWSGFFDGLRDVGLRKNDQISS